jgi:molybdopterin-guanine dinucleotide biosynthesis protein
MSDIKKIEIKISGTVQSGKSSIMQSIKEMLEAHNYGVVCAAREHRLNPEQNLEDADGFHIKPHPDKTVIVLVESDT